MILFNKKEEMAEERETKYMKYFQNAYKAKDEKKCKW